MFPKRVHPNIVPKFRIPDRDMARLAFCKTFPGEVTEHRGSMNENMFSMFLIRWKFWNACTRKFDESILPLNEKIQYKMGFSWYDFGGMTRKKRAWQEYCLGDQILMLFKRNDIKSGLKGNREVASPDWTMGPWLIASSGVLSSAPWTCCCFSTCFVTPTGITISDVAEGAISSGWKRWICRRNRRQVNRITWWISEFQSLLCRRMSFSS